MESDGTALESYIRKNTRFAKWDVLVVTSGGEDGVDIEGTDITIHPTVRPFSAKNSMLSVYGTKMRIGTMGLTKHGLSDAERRSAEERFRESKRREYESKYGDAAEQKLRSMSISDRAYFN